MMMTKVKELVREGFEITGKGWVLFTLKKARIAVSF